MSGLELNKIAASILIAGMVMAITGKIASVIYHPEESTSRGYSVDSRVVVAAATSTKSSAPAIATTIDVKPLLASANIANGQKITKKCSACHSFENGGRNKVGPNLWGIVGATVARNPDFSYSKAMKGKGGKWDYDSLANFLKSPKKTVKGTKMAFAGIKKEKDIADVIAYLRQQSSTPIPLP